jgi:hypothetical protein
MIVKSSQIPECTSGSRPPERPILYLHLDRTAFPFRCWLLVSSKCLQMLSSFQVNICAVGKHSLHHIFLLCNNIIHAMWFAGSRNLAVIRYCSVLNTTMDNSVEKNLDIKVLVWQNYIYIYNALHWWQGTHLTWFPYLQDCNCQLLYKDIHCNFIKIW